MSSEQTNNNPGLCPFKGQALYLLHSFLGITLLIEARNFSVRYGLDVMLDSSQTYEG
jgi:hypothetical protein